MYCGFTYEIRDETNPDLVYYGSSELPTLDERMKLHLNDFNTWKNTGKKYCSSFKVLELGNWTPTLLKIVFFTIKWELREQERKLIEHQTCVNERIPNRIYAEWYEDNKEHHKEQLAEYYQKNKVKIREQHAEWREANPNYKADYYQKNKDKINKKITCECGGRYTHQNKSIHIKSTIHQDWLKSSNTKNH
jgi:hypothetical protein